MNHISKKAMKAIEYVKKGDSINKAMLRAGYSKFFSSRAASNSKNLHNLLKIARDNYLAKYMQAATSTDNLQGDKIAQTLSNIIANGKDFDKISAIKVHSNYMLERERNSNQVNNLNVFVIPSSEVSSNWDDVKKKVIEGEIVE